MTTRDFERLLQTRIYWLVTMVVAFIVSGFSGLVPHVITRGLLVGACSLLAGFAGVRVMRTWDAICAERRRRDLAGVIHRNVQ
jgi:hypothetical protein